MYTNDHTEPTHVAPTNMDALFDIEPEEVVPNTPHYWHDVFPTYQEADAVDTMPPVFVVVRIARSPQGFIREAFGLTATRAEAAATIERFHAQIPGCRWDVVEYVPLPF